MELEDMDKTLLVGPLKDVETIEDWAERNGVTCDTARKWVGEHFTVSRIGSAGQ